MEFILHIGLPKTGSSSLQHALRDNRKALRRHGVIYPHTGIFNEKFNPKHEFLLRALVNNPKLVRMPEDWFSRFHEETAGADICVLSSENFSYIGVVGKLDYVENGMLNVYHLRQIRVNKRPKLT